MNKARHTATATQRAEQVLRDALDALRDAQDVAGAEMALSNSGELFPQDFVMRLVNGANPVLLYRQHRGLTQARLAERADVRPATISDLETGKTSVEQSSVATMHRIAAALGVDVEDLLPQPE